MVIEELKNNIYDHDHPEKQYQAAYQLRFAKNDSEAVFILFSACYEARDPRLQQEAVRSLSVLAPEKAFQAFIKMTHNSDPEKRRRAYYHLGTLGNPKGFSIVLRGLHDSEETVRKAAAISAGRLGENFSAINSLKKIVNNSNNRESGSVRMEISRSIEFIQKRINRDRGSAPPALSFNKESPGNEPGPKSFNKTRSPKSYSPKGF